MDRIQIQASQLWELLFSEETASTYQKALTLSGTILKETAQLLWLIICSVFVFVAWVGNTAIKTGKGLRDWIDQLSTDSPSSDGKPLSESAQEWFETVRTGAIYLLNQAREQLGLEAVEVQPTKSLSAASAPSQANTASSVSTKHKAESKPAATPAAQKPATPAATPAAPKPATTSAEKPVKAETTASEVTRETVDDGWNS